MEELYLFMGGLSTGFSQSVTEIAWVYRYRPIIKKTAAVIQTSDEIGFGVWPVFGMIESGLISDGKNRLAQLR